MNSKEIIKGVITHDNPPRIGLDFNPPHTKDIYWSPAAKLKNKSMPIIDWGENDSELGKQVPWFKGSLMRDEYGNIWGRVEGDSITHGEVVKGVLEDGYNLLNTYNMPEIDEVGTREIARELDENDAKFKLGIVGGFGFAVMRYMRKMDNLMVDMVLDKENHSRLNEMVDELVLKQIRIACNMGFDAAGIYEDWGTQTSLLISPGLWRELYKPSYKKLISEVHRLGMFFFMHSCGYIYEIIEDLIECGVDVFNFDQITLMGVDRLSGEFGGRVTFWNPVDSQKILQTGNKEVIQWHARDLIRKFGKFNGGFIAKDYPQLDCIGVKEEWAQWARDVFINEGNY